MKSLMIYDKRSAKKDRKKGKVTPLDASIFKWASLWDAMNYIHHEMNQSCGLCLEYVDMCDGCPLVDCTMMPDYKASIRMARETRHQIGKFLNKIRSVKE